MAKARTASHRGVRVSYELRGRFLRPHRPWLVLVQGLGFDRTGWGPVLPGLARRFRLVLVDNRGIGDSDAPSTPYAVQEMAGDIVAVLDGAGIDRAHVMGASLGGMVAQELAIGHPARVDRLVLVSTTPGWSGYPFPPANAWLLWENPRVPPEAGMRRRLEHALSPATLAHRPRVVDRLMAHQQARGQDRRARWSQVSAGVRYSNRFSDSDIAADTLVLHGTSDKVIDPRNAELLATRIPRARLELFADSGHLLFWEEPDRFVDVVTSFLEEGRRRTSPRRSPRRLGRALRGGFRWRSR